MEGVVVCGYYILSCRMCGGIIINGILCVKWKNYCKCYFKGESWKSDVGVKLLF